MSRAGLSKDKQEKAKKLAKDFQQGVKGADRPAQAKDRAAVVKAYEATLCQRLRAALVGCCPCYGPWETVADSGSYRRLL